MMTIRMMAGALVVMAIVGVARGEDAKAEAKIKELTEKITKQVDGAENASDKVKEYVKKNLIPLCTDQVFAEQVKAQNDKKTSLDEIKKIDKEWTEAEDELAIHKEKMGNECAKRIGEIAKKLPGIGEVFVMDNQGANVGQNRMTSDYWQGDEAKWKNSYAEGKGGVDVGKSKYDDSTASVQQQVSLPIIDKSGDVIGAVCFGLLVDKL